MNTLSKIAFFNFLMIMQLHAMNKEVKSPTSPSPIIHNEQQQALILSIRNSLMSVMNNSQAIADEPYNGPATTQAIGNYWGNLMFLNRHIHAQSEEFNTLHTINDLLYRAIRDTNAAKSSRASSPKDSTINIIY